MNTLPLPGPPTTKMTLLFFNGVTSITCAINLVEKKELN